MQIDRIGFIRKNFPNVPDIDVILRNCAERFPNPAFLVQKYSAPSNQVNEEDAARALGSDFFIQNKVVTQMTHSFETGLDKLAWRSASQFHQECQSSKPTSVRERFNDLVKASIICLTYEYSSSSTSVAPLQDCEAIIAQAFKDIAADAAAAAKGLPSSRGTKEEGDVFYPSATDIMRCKLIRALTYLSNKNLLQCARTLLSLPDICIDVPDEKINDIASVSDMVMYTVLCSMATMSRGALRTDLYENPNFREWLARDDCKDLKVLLDSFFHGNWSTAWKTLEVVISAAHYDMFMSKLSSQLRNHIQDKMLLEYSKAYNLVDIDTMAKAFGLSRDSLEDRLVKLIDSGSLSARIDGIEHKLVRYTPDPRLKAFESTVSAGKAFEDWTDRDVFYANIIDGGYLEADVAKKIPFADDKEYALLLAQAALGAAGPGGFYGGAGNFEHKKHRRLADVF